MEMRSAIYRFIFIAAAFAMAWAPHGASAQHYAGVRAGYGMGSIGRIEPAETTGQVWGQLSGGFSYKYYGDVDRFANGVEIDFQFFQKGFKRNTPYSGAPADTTVMYIREINSVELPIFWHPHFEFMKGRLGVFLNLGVSVSYNINSTYEWRSAIDGTLEKGDYEMVLIRDNRWNYGLAGGVGVSYIAGRSEFYFEGRYYVGYSDILKNKNVYPDNPRQSPLDAMTFSIGYFYRLGKKKE